MDVKGSLALLVHCGRCKSCTMTWRFSAWESDGQNLNVVSSSDAVAGKGKGEVIRLSVAFPSLFGTAVELVDRMTARCKIHLL